MGEGSQFTSADFTGRLLKAGISISMTRKRVPRRALALDNIFVERLWRTVKYEDIYLKGYQTPREVFCGLGEYFPYYNEERPHQALDYRTPAAVYRGA